MLSVVANHVFNTLFNVRNFCIATLWSNNNRYTHWYVGNLDAFNRFPFISWSRIILQIQGYIPMTNCNCSDHWNSLDLWNWNILLWLCLRETDKPAYFWIPSHTNCRSSPVLVCISIWTINVLNCQEIDGFDVP